MSASSLTLFIYNRYKAGFWYFISMVINRRNLRSKFWILVFQFSPVHFQWIGSQLHFCNNLCPHLLRNYSLWEGVDEDSSPFGGWLSNEEMSEPQIQFWFFFRSCNHPYCPWFIQTIITSEEKLRSAWQSGCDLNAKVLLECYVSVSIHSHNH